MVEGFSLPRSTLTSATLPTRSAISRDEEKLSTMNTQVLKPAGAVLIKMLEGASVNDQNCRRAFQQRVVRMVGRSD